MAGTVISLHFQSFISRLSYSTAVPVTILIYIFISRLKSCPITQAYGASGTGKTTALHCGLAFIGADDLRFYRQLTAAKVLQLCSSTSIPLGVDDPDTKTSFSKIIIDLYNGVKCGTISRGETKPKSTVVISTNVTPKDQLRYC